MRPIVIFGAGEIAEVAEYYFRTTAGRNVVAFVVDGAYLRERLFAQRPVVAAEEVAGQYPPGEHDAFVAISYSRMNVVRAEKAAFMRDAGYRLTSYVSPRANVFTEAVGANCLILEDNTIQPFVTIGDNVTLWSGNHIGHHARIEDNVFITSHVVVSGGVTVGANSFIGVNATIRDHVSVAAFTLVGAGGLILEDTEAEGVYMAPSPAEKRKVKSTRLPKI